MDEDMQSLASSLMRGATSRAGFNYWDKRALRVRRLPHPSPPSPDGLACRGRLTLHHSLPEMHETPAL